MKIINGVLRKIESSDLSKDGHITIPDEVTTIGNLAFASLEELVSVTTNQGLITIEDSAFINCVNLRSVMLSKTITNIGERAFMGCTQLTEIHIEPGITTLNAGMFFGCTNLSTVTLPPGLLSIGWGAFLQCNISSITIPESVTTIAEHAFDQCKNLSLVILSDKIIDINPLAFAHCPNISLVIIDRSRIDKFYCLVIPKELKDRIIERDEYVKLQALQYRCIEELRGKLITKLSTQLWSSMPFGYASLLVGGLIQLMNDYLSHALPAYQNALEELPNIPLAREQNGEIKWSDYQTKFSKILDDKFNKDFTGILFPAKPSEIGLFANNSKEPALNHILNQILQNKCSPH